MTKLLSIVSHGRNDGWMHNFIWRLETTLNKMGDNIAALNASDIEIVLCDWGSPKNAKLCDVLKLNESCRSRLRYFYFEPELVKSVELDSTYSSSHSMNAVVQRATGKYILSVDSDIYWRADAMHALYEAMQKNELAGHNMEESFFWAARYHIPKSYNMTCPTIEHMDKFIDDNQHTFVRDKPDKHVFAGAAVALLATNDMWRTLRGLDERLIYWGANDLDIHARLMMKYRWGGDIDDYGIRFYHLEHYYVRNLAAENPRKANENWRPPTTIAVNGDNWGLANVDVPEQTIP